MKVIQRILDLKEIEEEYRLQTRKTTKNYSNIETDLKEEYSMGTYRDYRQ